MGSGGSRGKKSEAYEALRSLMAKPGNFDDIWSDLLPVMKPELSKGVARVTRALVSPNYDDRTAALVYGAMVEQALEIAITAHFASDVSPGSIFSYDDGGAFATFAAKISLGRALGIYEDGLGRNLKWIKNIRNAFAHARVKVDFATPEIAVACEQLRIRRITDGPPAIQSPELGPRDRYAYNAGLSAHYLSTSKGQRFNHSAFYHALFVLPAE